MASLEKEVFQLKSAHGSDAMRTQVSILAQEMVDLKTIYKIPAQRGSLMASKANTD